MRSETSRPFSPGAENSAGVRRRSACLAEPARLRETSFPKWRPDEALRAEVHEAGRPHGGAAGAHAAGRARRGPGPRHRGLAGLRARDRRRQHPALGGAASDGVRRAARGDARPGREHARSAQAVRRRARQARARGLEGGAGRHLRLRVLRQPAPPRRGPAQEEARLHAARLRHGGAAGPGRRVRLRWAQPDAVDGSEPRAVRARLRAAAEGGQATRPRVPRRAVPHAGLDDGRQLAQQPRLCAGRVDRLAPDLREARRRRSAPHPLRPVARDPHGSGHALAVPVPQGSGLRVPDRRLPRQGAGRRREGRLGLGLRRADDGAGRLAGRAAVAEPGGPVEGMAQADGVFRARAAGHCSS